MTKKTGMFKKIKEKSVAPASKYIRPADYLLEIDTIKLTESKKGDTFLVATFKVIECTRAKFHDEPGHKTGDYVSYFIRQNHFFINNVKQLIQAATNIVDFQIDEELAEAIIGPAQPLKGKLIRCAARNIKTKAGHDFTKCTWIHEGSSILPSDVKGAHGKHKSSMKKIGKNKDKAKKELTKQQAKAVNFGQAYGKTDKDWAALKDEFHKHYPENKPEPKEEKKPTQTKFERKIML